MELGKERLTDVLLGGLGGAVAAVLLTLLFDRYFDSVEREAVVNAKEQILEAKEAVINEILVARQREREHMLQAITTAQNASAAASIAKQKATESLDNLSVQEKRVEEIVKALEQEAGGTVNDIAKALQPEVVRNLEKLAFPSGAVVAFELSNCPEGWQEFAQAQGRFVIGVGRGEGLSERTLLQSGGSETHTLTIGEMPRHTHSGNISTGGYSVEHHQSNSRLPVQSWSRETGASGGGQAHNNIPPFIALRYCRKS